MGVKLAAASGGSIELVPTNTASNFTVTVPAVTATALTDSAGILNIGSGQIYKDANGNLGLGVTPSAWGSAYSKAIQISTQGAYVAGNTTGYSGGTYAWFGNNGYLDSAAAFRYTISTSACQYQQVANSHQWLYAPNGTAGGLISFSEAMRIDSSGNLLVGTTSTAPNPGVAFYPSGGLCTGNSNGTTGFEFAAFRRNATQIGSITQNGTTGVLYNLTSDYRLKNNPQALTGAKEFVMALQPKKWQWWDGSGEGVGFIAHEFMEVAKYSGHGIKDAVETVEIKDEQGNVTGTEQRPVHQSIQPSSSEVMANLVAFIQEQQALIVQLQTDVAALKGAQA